MNRPSINIYKIKNNITYFEIRIDFLLIYYWKGGQDYLFLNVAKESICYNEDFLEHRFNFFYAAQLPTNVLYLHGLCPHIEGHTD